MIRMDEIERLLFSGGDVVGEDGRKIGGIGEVFLDASSGQPAWVTVKTGLFGTSESFVPLTGADVRGDAIHVPFGKDTVKHAPRMETTGGHLSSQEERDLYRYYGLVDDEPEPHDRPADDRPTDDGSADLGHARHVRDDDARHDRDLHDGDLHDGVGDGDRRDDVRDTDSAHADPAPVPAPEDGSLVRSEERLRVVGTERVPTERVRMRRYTVTETREVTVPVTREEFRLEYEPAEPGATGEVLDPDTRGTERAQTAVDPDGSSRGSGRHRR